jgi:hypothetical protein
VSLAEDQHVIQALAPDRPDEALRERILPVAVWRREDPVNPHGRHPVPELLAIDLVTISEEVRRRGLVREGVHELLTAIQAAVGCSVTLKWTTRLRSTS